MSDLKLGQFSGIVFDLDGTLVHKKPKLDDFIQNAFEKRGILVSSDQRKLAQKLSLKFWEDPANYNNDPTNHDSNRGIEFWINYIRYSYQFLDISASDLGEVATELADISENDERIEYLVENTREVLAALSARGFKLGVLSNRYSPVSDVIQHYGLSPFISCSYSAGELGVMKPDERIFHLYLQKFGKHSDEIVYVGDNYWVDIKGAQKANIQPVLIDPENLFPEVTCPVIRSLSDLLPMLN